MSNSGYSYLLPSIAQGLSQRDFISLKDLENDVLELGEKMKPLSSAFTQTAAGASSDADEKGGRPKKD
jgi:hypothetical protein